MFLFIYLPIFVNFCENLPHFISTLLLQAEAELTETFRQPATSCPEVEEQVEVFRVWVGEEGQESTCTYVPNMFPP